MKDVSLDFHKKKLSNFALPREQSELNLWYFQNFHEKNVPLGMHPGRAGESLAPPIISIIEGKNPLSCALKSNFLDNRPV